MEAVVNFVPADTLRDRSKVQGLVKLFDPFVRAFDGIAGERVSMRIWSAPMEGLLLVYSLIEGSLCQWELQQLHSPWPFLRGAHSLVFGSRRSQKGFPSRQGHCCLNVQRKEQLTS